MRVFDLFSGTGSVSLAARSLGHDAVSLDYAMPADIQCDLLKWDHTVYPPGHFDIIACSPPCKAQQNRTEQNRQKLKNRKNIQEQTKPYLQNKQLILACGSRARQRLPADGQKCDMESQVGHIAINRPDKAHQSLIYYARAHTHARSAKMTKNMAVLRSL